MHNLLLFAAEGGHEENGAIIPHDINEVIWGSIAFFIVFGLIIWKGGPAIKNMWNGRIDRIRAELDAAEAARVASEGKLAEVETRIADADQERSRIRTEAQQTAAAVAQQIAERSVTDAEEIRQRARADADNARAQAGADLEAELALVAIGAAESVVQHNLDAATQRELIESYISRVGSGVLSPGGGDR
jgi:F-type H+-transporting ATPase subunit b